MRCIISLFSVEALKQIRCSLALDLCTSLPENCKHATNLIFFKRKNREAICKVRLIEIQELVPAGSKILCICETMLYKQSDNVLVSCKLILQVK